MKALNNSNVAGFTAKAAALGSEEYSERVARPVMMAIETMPKAYRQCVDDYGYVDVYRAWRKGYTPQEIRARADVNGGVFRI